jgi:AcrR family transcriptional regulator
MERRRTAEESGKRTAGRKAPVGDDPFSLAAMAVSSLATSSPEGTDARRRSKTGRGSVERPEPNAAVETEALKPMRERILDVALDLFTENGYEETSLREVAASLGVTKAALYYHFASKEDILFALHLRLHAVMSGFDDELAAPMSKDSWHRMLDAFIDRVPANRKVIALHARNRAAFEKIHHPDHAQDHQDLGERLTGALSDESLATSDRIRMGLALATVMGGLVFGGETFDDIKSEELTVELKSAIDDLLR